MGKIDRRLPLGDFEPLHYKWYYAILVTVAQATKYPLPHLSMAHAITLIRFSLSLLAGSAAFLAIYSIGVEAAQAGLKII